MRRAWLVWIAVIGHALVALACLIVVGLVLRESRKPNIIAEGRDTLHGLYLGGAIVGGCALVYIVSAVGLGKRWRWAWWWSLAADLLLITTFFWDLVVERERWDWEDHGIGLGFLVLVVLLVLSRPRKTSAPVVAGADSVAR